jgi:glucose-6-phosphate 1-dehydrogenase
MRGRDVELQFCSMPDDEAEAYERLIGDAIRGDPTLFARQDAIEAQWRIIEPVLHTETAVHSYARGSWGPREADALTEAWGGWLEPASPNGNRSPR